MKDRKNLTRLMVIMVMAVAAATAVTTMFTGCRHGQGKSPEVIADRIIGKITSELELNDAQKQFLGKVKDEVLKKAAEMKENRQAMRKEVLTQLRGEAIDQEQLKKVFADHKAQTDEIISLLISRLAEFHSTLTPEQKDKLVKHLEELESKCPFGGKTL